MRIVTPSFYKNFKCIAGACPDSCCQGWEVDADLDSLAFYKTLVYGLQKIYVFIPICPRILIKQQKYLDKTAKNSKNVVLFLSKI